MDDENLFLREFRPEDAPVIVSWIKNRDEQRMWSADRYSSFPPAAEEMRDMYRLRSEKGKFFPFCMTDGEKLLGHFILRYPSDDEKHLRIGFVIVDPSLRGTGLGKKMMALAENRAKELGASRLSLGVFKDNPPATGCYGSCGFTITGEEDYTVFGETYPGYLMEKEI